MLENVKINPHKVYIGANQAQVQKIKTVAGTLLGGKYFTFMDAAGAKRYAWFDTGSSVDPAPAGGWIGSDVDVLVGDSASQIATKLAAVLTLVSGFDAVASGDVVTLTHTANGYAQPAKDGAGVSATNFAFSVDLLGSVERLVGCISGDLEISGFEQTKVEVRCHDTGATVQKEIVSGYSNPTIAMTLQELDKETLKKVLIDAGMFTFTPVGADAEEVIGYGQNNLGASNPRVLVRLHPVSLDSSNKSEDWNCWQCELGLDTLTLSGENVSTLPVTFKMYPDNAKPKSIQFFMIGDAAKAGY
jgi:hypothetical protein